MRKEFEKLNDLLFRSNVTDEASGDCVWGEVNEALNELKSKIDEFDKRVHCVKKMSDEINKTISKYTESVDRGEHIKMSVNEHDTLFFCANDIVTALDFENNTCIEENWCDLFKQRKKEEVKYEFKEEVYTIGNADNTEMICDVYESDFITLCQLQLIWCEDDKEFPIGKNKTNYVVRSNEYIDIVKNKAIGLNKVQIKEEVFEHEKIVEEVISKLKGIEVDGETMEYILRRLGLEEQVFQQIAKKNEFNIM